MLTFIQEFLFPSLSAYYFAAVIVVCCLDSVFGFWLYVHIVFCLLNCNVARTKTAFRTHLCNMVVFLWRICVFPCYKIIFKAASTLVSRVSIHFEGFFVLVFLLFDFF